MLFLGFDPFFIIAEKIVFLSSRSNETFASSPFNFKVASYSTGLYAGLILLEVSNDIKV